MSLSRLFTLVLKLAAAMVMSKEEASALDSSKMALPFGASKVPLQVPNANFMLKLVEPEITFDVCAELLTDINNAKASASWVRKIFMIG